MSVIIAAKAVADDLADSSIELKPDFENSRNGM